MDEYGVLLGYEDGLDEDDEGGSRAIPSRTSLGTESAFVEKFPEYGRTRWGVRHWGYRCFLTLPQIELMSADLPHTLYRNKKKADADEEAEMIRMTQEAAERRRKAKESGEYTIEDVFDGLADE